MDATTWEAAVSTGVGGQRRADGHPRKGRHHEPGAVPSGGGISRGLSDRPDRCLRL